MLKQILCRNLSIFGLLMTLSMGALANDIPLLPPPAEDPVCHKYEQDKKLQVLQKKAEKYKETYQAVLQACRRPWVGRLWGRMKSFGSTATSTFMLKFSQSDDEIRKRKIMQAVAEMEKKNGGKLAPEVYERLGIEKLGWYERIPTLPLNERVHNWGVSKSTAEILNFEGLDAALAECYPKSPVMRLWFIQGLVYDDTAPQAVGVAAGGVAMFYGGGWLVKGIGKLFSWVPRGLRYVGLTDKSIRYLKYTAISAGIGGSLYSWRMIHQEEMRKVQDGETVLRELNSGVRDYANQISNYREQCLTEIEQAMTHKDNKDMYRFFIELAKLPCDYYVQTATAAISEMTERPLYRCDRERPVVLREVVKDLEDYQALYANYFTF